MPHREEADVTPRQASEVAAGERFEFGKNWTRFLATLDAARIEEAVNSLREMLAVDSLAGLSFVDVGSGSGLFSLAARRLGARVLSFDYDPYSVNCTRELRQRYYPGDEDWQVESGSILDQAYLARLGAFDIVYSWGVLHHTGQLWQALENAINLVAIGGKCFIALYNDQGGPSRRWRWVKRTYCRYPLLRYPLLIASFWRLIWRSLLKDVLLLRPGHTFRAYRRNHRGMSLWYDVVDWVGGYPFEVSSPQQVFEFCRARGFVLVKLITDRDLGCNQFVFHNYGKVL
jgi:2-polyprenyl-3-methyl-5-hydroxy-6-metoxy-1,4-benzoquinol methylase